MAYHASRESAWVTRELRCIEFNRQEGFFRNTCDTVQPHCHSCEASFGHLTCRKDLQKHCRWEEAIQKADIIFFMVTDDKASEGIAMAALKLSGCVRNKLYVDCSTIALETTTRIAEEITKANGSFLAMPVFGTPDVAEAGQLVCVPAGPKSCVNKERPYLEGVMARTVIDMADQSSSNAMKLKLLWNFFNLVMTEAVVEANMVTEKSGLGAENLYEFTESMPGPWGHFNQLIISGDYYEKQNPSVDIESGLKDARLTKELAPDNGARLRFTETGYEQLEKVLRHAMQDHSSGDIIHLYGVTRLDAGLVFGNGAV